MVDSHDGGTTSLDHFADGLAVDEDEDLGDWVDEEDDE